MTSKYHYVTLFREPSLTNFFRQQAERDWVLAEFKSGRSPIMLATDVASRGLGTYTFLLTRDGHVHVSDMPITVSTNELCALVV